MRSRVLVVCASECNRRGMERPGVRRLCDSEYHLYDDRYHRSILEGSRREAPFYDPRALVDEVVRRAEAEGAAGLVVSHDYPGAILASAAARRLGLRAPSLESVVACQHKVLSRRLQTRAVPEATPRFAWFGGAENGASGNGSLPFPCFVKPVRANFSFGAGRVESEEDLHRHLARFRVPEEYLSPLRWAMGQSGLASENGCGGLLAEELLTGIQVTLEGIAAGGEVHLVGVVDSHFFPSTLAFERFQYPSALPGEIQQRMFDVCRRFIQAIGFDDGLFNVELVVDPATGRVSIIEVNPRMCSQFADLMEKVDGVSTYEHAARVALGLPVSVPRGEGPYAVAASFVLRTFEDRRVLAAPTAEDLARLEEAIPGLEAYVWAEEGRRLSEMLQDPDSYAYGRLNLGARDEQELREKFDQCRRRLGVVFG